MGTFSKSLASCGGFIAGDADIVDFLRLHARSFLFTASAVPAAIGAALAAVKIAKTDEGKALMARVLENAEYLWTTLNDAGIRVVDPGIELGERYGIKPFTPIVPIVVGEDWEAGRGLEGALRRWASTRTSRCTRRCRVVGRCCARA